MKYEIRTEKQGDADGSYYEDMIVAEKQGILRNKKRIGHAILQIYGFDNNSEKGIASLPRVTVNKKYRGKGIGKKMIEAAISDAQERGAGIISVEPGVDDIDFYKKLGFKEVDNSPRMDKEI